MARGEREAKMWGKPGHRLRRRGLPVPSAAIATQAEGDDFGTRPSIVARDKITASAEEAVSQMAAHTDAGRSNKIPHGEEMAPQGRPHRTPARRRVDFDLRHAADSHEPTERE